MAGKPFFCCEGRRGSPPSTQVWLGWTNIPGTHTMGRCGDELALLLTGPKNKPWRNRASHLKEMLKTTSFGRKQNFSNSFLALCLPFPPYLPPRSKRGEGLGTPSKLQLLKAGEHDPGAAVLRGSRCAARSTRQELRGASHHRLLAFACPWRDPQGEGARSSCSVGSSCWIVA